MYFLTIYYATSFLEQYFPDLPLFSFKLRSFASVESHHLLRLISGVVLISLIVIGRFVFWLKYVIVQVVYAGNALIYVLLVYDFQLSENSSEMDAPVILKSINCALRIS